jgi:hypothetical protein
MSKEQTYTQGGCSSLGGLFCSALVVSGYFVASKLIKGAFDKSINRSIQSLPDN